MSRNALKAANKSRNAQPVQTANAKTPFSNSFIADVIFDEATKSYSIVSDTAPVVTVTEKVITLAETENSTFEQVALVFGDVKHTTAATALEALALLEVVEDVQFAVEATEVAKGPAPLPDAIGEQMVMVIGASPVQSLYRTGKGSISDVAKRIGCVITRFVADQGFGITINVDLELDKNYEHTMTVAIQGGKPVSAVLQNVSGGVGMTIADPELATLVMAYGAQAKVIGFDIELNSVELEKPITVHSFDLNNSPELFNDSDELVHTFLQRIWSYVCKMHLTKSQTPASVAEHTRALMTIMDQITNLNTDEFGLIMPSLEEIFSEYHDQVFCERLVTRGIHTVRDKKAVARLLAMMNILRVVTTTTDQNKLHMVLDLHNLDQHGFAPNQAENLNAYFNI